MELVARGHADVLDDLGDPDELGRVVRLGIQKDIAHQYAVRAIVVGVEPVLVRQGPDPAILETLPEREELLARDLGCEVPHALP